MTKGYRRKTSLICESHSLLALLTKKLAYSSIGEKISLNQNWFYSLSSVLTMRSIFFTSKRMKVSRLFQNSCVAEVNRQFNRQILVKWLKCGNRYKIFLTVCLSLIQFQNGKMKYQTKALTHHFTVSTVQLCAFYSQFCYCQNMVAINL